MAEIPSQLDDELMLHALADGELDPTTAVILERRLETEPALAAEFERIMALKERVAGLDRPEVSADFEALIAGLAAPAAVPRSRPANSNFSGWRSIAASVIVTAFVASSATYLVVGPRAGLSIAEIVAGSHRRSLLATNPVDVVSSDRHTVKPWLDAKLGISPPAPDMSAQGYPLVGGRVDVLGADTVPTLVYRHNEHLITLMAAPGSNTATPAESATVNGYNTVHWMAGGFSFWAVSDLEPVELKAFVADYRSN